MGNRKRIKSKVSELLKKIEEKNKNSTLDRMEPQNDQNRLKEEGVIITICTGDLGFKLINEYNHGIKQSRIQRNR